MKRKLPSFVVKSLLAAYAEETDTLLFVLRRSGLLLMHANQAAQKAFRESSTEKEDRTGLSFIPKKAREELMQGETPVPLKVKYNGRVYKLRFFRLSQIVVQGIEVTKEHQEMDRYRLDARHDECTGLASRRYFEEQYPAKRAQALRHNMALEEQKKKLAEQMRINDVGMLSGLTKQNLALYFLDLNKFKEVNDTYGHLFADELIAAVGDRFRELIRRDTDIIARYGGKADEFLGLSVVHGEKDAIEFAKRIISYFSKPFVVRGKRILLSLAIGIRFVEVELDIGLDRLIEQADHAMYQSKTEKQPYVLFRGRK